MRLNINDIGGNIAKEDDRYIVKDNTTLKNLVVSSTRLKQRKATTGHKHEGQEDVHAGMHEDLYFVCVFDGRRSH